MEEVKESIKINRTIAKILQAKEVIEKQGIKPTQTNVAEFLGITKQSVNTTLINHNKLDEFNKDELERIEALRKIDTSNMNIKEILKLPQVHGHFIYEKFRRIVIKNNIHHKRSLLERILEIDTDLYTIAELADKLQAHQRSVRQLIADNKLPYKKVGAK